MQNFAAIAAELVQSHAAVRVTDAAELELTFEDLLGNPAKRVKLGHKARAVVQKNQGVLNRTVEMIVNRLDGRCLYVASPM